jgi:hypothetical protein
MDTRSDQNNSNYNLETVENYMVFQTNKRPNVVLIELYEDAAGGENRLSVDSEETSAISNIHTL